MSASDSLPYRGKLLIRTIGAILLSTAGVMLVLGLTVLSERLQGPEFVLYWSWCFLITALALIVALVDLLMIRRASKQTKLELVRQHLLRAEPGD
jgi:Co/Zn/Cd efflux system component